MRNAAILFACLAVTMMTACNSSGKPKDGKIDAAQAVKEALGKSSAQTEITAANWQSVIKKRFGIDLTTPQGWLFSDVKAYFSGETVLVIFESGGDNAAKPRDIARTIFDATKAISSEGNFNVDIHSNEAATSVSITKSKVWDTFDENQPVVKMFGEDYINAFWYYKKDGIKVVNVNCDKGKFVVKFEISKISI
jgi:hypothetical protein